MNTLPAYSSAEYKMFMTRGVFYERAVQGYTTTGVGAWNQTTPIDCVPGLRGRRSQSQGRIPGSPSMAAIIQLAAGVAAQP